MCIRLNALRSAGGIDHLAHKRGSGAWAGALDYELGMLSLRMWRRGFATGAATVPGADAPPEHAWRAAKLSGKLADVRAKGQTVAHDVLYKMYADFGDAAVHAAVSANGKLDLMPWSEDRDIRRRSQSATVSSLLGMRIDGEV